MGQILDVDIVKLGASGDGIAGNDGIVGNDGMATLDGMPIFVPFTALGDRAKIRLGKKERFGFRAELIAVMEEGATRRTAPCQHFGRCGGCQLQHITAASYADWIITTIAETLARHGLGDAVIAPPIISPTASRRRVTLKALKRGKNLILGFNKRRSHQIVPLKECPVTHPAITALFTPLHGLLGDLLPERTSAEIALTHTDSGVDMLISASMTLGLTAREALVVFANIHDLATLNWRDGDFLDPVVHRRQAMMRFGAAKVPLPPAAFIQASAEGEAALVSLVRDAVRGADHVADFFSGLGTFSFPLAEKAKVAAFEGFKPAVEAFTMGVNRAKGLRQIRAHHRDLFRRPLSVDELQPFDAVVFDPPRVGAREQVEILKNSAVPTVVAVSCNPNSFARDGRVLIDGGYRLETVSPVDQFLWSSHLELVGVYRKG